MTAGSTFGYLFRVTTWGESHGSALGAVIDGCPAGFPLCEADIEPYMARRRPGGVLATARREEDRVEILSGVFEGKTTGTALSLLIRNKDQRSRDYSQIAEIFRPGHADFGYDIKYGIRDYRGGGRSSGRETASRVAAGAVAALILKEFGITFETYVSRIGEIELMPGTVPETDAQVLAYIDELKKEGDSVGSEVVCIIKGVPAGIGDPVFRKLDASLAGAVFSIGAVKGFEIGDGFAVVRTRGSKNNDPFCAEDGRIRTKTNHAGGILGGISTGEDIVMRAAFKPTPSISLPQETVSRSGKPVTVSVTGRHDPVIGPRAAVVVEAMGALVILDALMMSGLSRFEDLRNSIRHQ